MKLLYIFSILPTILLWHTQVSTVGNNPLAHTAGDVFNGSCFLKKIYEGKFEESISLIEENPDVLQEVDIHQNTALHLAAQGGYIAAVHYLLDSRLTLKQISAKNSHDQSALDIVEDQIINLETSSDILDYISRQNYMTIRTILQKKLSP